MRYSSKHRAEPAKAYQHVASVGQPTVGDTGKPSRQGCALYRECPSCTLDANHLCEGKSQLQRADNVCLRMSEENVSCHPVDSAFFAWRIVWSMVNTPLTVSPLANRQMNLSLRDADLYRNMYREMTEKYMCSCSKGSCRLFHNNGSPERAKVAVASAQKMHMKLQSAGNEYSLPADTYHLTLPRL